MNASTQRKRAGRGFALLEAIVALTLLAGTGVALFAWIQQSMESASRVDAAQRRAQLLLDAQALIEHVNPALQPSGSVSSSGLQLRWASRTLQPMKSNTGFTPGAAGSWQIGLFQLSVDVRRDVTGAEPVTFEAVRLGWRPVIAVTNPS